MDNTGCVTGVGSGQVWVSVQGNNEVGCWSLESASRQQVLISYSLLDF